MLTVIYERATFYALLLTAFVLCAVDRPLSRAAETGAGSQQPWEAAGVAGGLCVEVGCDDTARAVDMARTGQFLVHLLDADAAAVDRARQKLQADGVYGLVSADVLTGREKLPYAENLVNLLVIGADREVPLAETVRVLCPRGVLLLGGDKRSAADLRAAGLDDVRAIQAGGSWLAARKPWPKDMDQWPQARHAADGNAVSHDTLVAPPRRIRWIAGPPQEISNMVTCDGRNFYAGVFARDSFNGLRLWERKLDPSPARGGFNFRFAPGSLRPVAEGSRLFVFSDNEVLALDGATGKQLSRYPAAGAPTELMFEAGLLIAIDAKSVRAVDAASGALRWQHDAPEPQHVVAGDGAVFLVEGDVRQGDSPAALRLALADGKPQWRRDDLAWLPKVRRSVYHEGLLVFEISTLSDDKPGNRIEVLSAADGKPLWSHEFIPGTAHWKQARTMFAAGLLWVLDHKKCVAMDPHSGKVKKSFPAGWGHCFPPVATGRFLFAGEMDLTDLETGCVDANRITKGSCGRDSGFVPANGLIYTAPKHCVCWPMLRDYTALAPARPAEPPPTVSTESCATASPEAVSAGATKVAASVEATAHPLERGPAQPPAGGAAGADPERQWPCYRHDAWRSGSTPEAVPTDLKILWTADLAGWPDGPIADDWRQNSFIRGPVTAPVVAGGLVYVARADAHQVVALAAGSGEVRWTFTANGRIDTAPTIHRGLCLFGAKSGWVYCLRADDGRMVWRLRAAPLDERIVAYGQLESPWPVPGSVLVVDDALYFAAGRQPLADGGIRVFAAEPATGKVRWSERLDSVPQTQFYGAQGLEFDNFDLLHREGSSVSMSRWLFDRQTGAMTCNAKSGFAHLTTGGCGVQFPRGCWSYAPRNESEQTTERPLFRPLAVFRDHALYGCSEDRQSLFRRDFTADAVAGFNTEWFNKWSTQTAAKKGGDLWRSQRLAQGATWRADTAQWPGGPQKIAAMTLTRDALFLVGAQGGLTALAPSDGKLLGRVDVPAPLWDGMAAAGGRLFVATRDGRVLCLGGRK